MKKIRKTIQQEIFPRTLSRSLQGEAPALTELWRLLQMRCAFADIAIQLAELMSNAEYCGLCYGTFHEFGHCIDFYYLHSGCKEEKCFAGVSCLSLVFVRAFFYISVSCFRIQILQKILQLVTRCRQCFHGSGHEFL